MFGVSILLAGVGSISSSLVLYPLGKGIYINSVNAFLFRVFEQLLCGMHYDIVQGEQHLEHTTPSIYVCNHQSLMDMLVISAALPTRCVLTAKKEIKYIPIMVILSLAISLISLLRNYLQIKSNLRVKFYLLERIS